MEGGALAAQAEIAGPDDAVLNVYVVAVGAFVVVVVDRHAGQLGVERGNLCHRPMVALGRKRLVKDTPTDLQATRLAEY